MERRLEFLRFDLHQRIQHIGMFSSFLVLTITGLPIKFNESRISPGIVSLFGGFDTMFNVHLVAAVLMIAVFVYHLIYMAIYPFYYKKASLKVLPNRRDFSDLIHDLQFLLGLREDRPRFALYSYKEKFDYWAVFWGMAIMGGSGLMLWFPRVFTQYMPRWVIDSAKYAHSDEAMLAIVAIFVWHFFNVHLNPRYFPMNHIWYRGKMSRGEMEEEHALELERLDIEDEEEASRQKQREYKYG